MKDSKPSKDNVDNDEIEMEERKGDEEDDEEDEDEDEEEEESEGGDDEVPLMSETADLESDPVIDFFLRKFREVERGKIIVATLLLVSITSFVTLLPARMLFASHNSESYFATRDVHLHYSLKALNQDLLLTELSLSHIIASWDPTSDSVDRYIKKRDHLQDSLTESTSRLNSSNIQSLQLLSSASAVINSWVPKADSIVRRAQDYTVSVKHKESVESGLPLPDYIQQLHKDITTLCVNEIVKSSDVDVSLLHAPEKDIYEGWLSALRSVVQKSLDLCKSEYLVILYGNTEQHILFDKSVIELKDSLQHLQTTLLAIENDQLPITPTVTPAMVQEWRQTLNEEVLQFTIIITDRIAQDTSRDSFQQIMKDTYELVHIMPVDSLLEISQLERDVFAVKKRL